MFSFLPSYTQVADISAGMAAHNLKLNPDKTKLIFIQPVLRPLEQQSTWGSPWTTSCPSQLTCSCQFLLYNIRCGTDHSPGCRHLMAGLRKIPLVWVACLCNQNISTHTERSPSSGIQPPQVHSLYTLHWLPMVARIKSKSLVLAYLVMTGTASFNLQSIRCCLFTPWKGQHGSLLAIFLCPCHSNLCFVVCGF